MLRQSSAPPWHQSGTYCATVHLTGPASLGRGEGALLWLPSASRPPNPLFENNRYQWFSKCVCVCVLHTYTFKWPCGQLKFIRKETWETSYRTLHIKDHLRRCMSLTQFRHCYFCSVLTEGREEGLRWKRPCNKTWDHSLPYASSTLGPRSNIWAWAELCKTVQQQSSQ